MTPQEHYRAAEQLLDASDDLQHLPEREAAYLRAAQVHATLACAVVASQEQAPPPPPHRPY